MSRVVKFGCGALLVVVLLCLIVLISAVIHAAMFGGLPEASHRSEGMAAKKPATEVAEEVKPVASSLPDAPDEMIVNLVVETISQHPEVRDAYMKGEGRQITLALVISPNTSRPRAQELGDNLVRLAKSMLDDNADPSGKDTIGRGVYEYRITVGAGAKDVWWVGAKVPSADQIRW